MLTMDPFTIFTKRIQTLVLRRALLRCNGNIQRAAISIGADPAKCYRLLRWENHWYETNYLTGANIYADRQTIVGEEPHDATL